MVAAKKGIVMKIQNKKNYIYCITTLFGMFLFAACLTMNVFLCSNYNLYELLDKTTVIKTWTISECIITNEDGDNTTCCKFLFKDKNTSHTETIVKNICPISMIAAIPQRFSLLLFLIIVFLFFFLNLFIFLSDRWTLVKQKIRLDI